MCLSFARSNDFLAGQGGKHRVDKLRRTLIVTNQTGQWHSNYQSALGSIVRLTLNRRGHFWRGTEGTKRSSERASDTEKERQSKRGSEKRESKRERERLMPLV